MGFAGMNHAWMDLGPCSLWRKGKRFLTQESRTPGVDPERGWGEWVGGKSLQGGEGILPWPLFVPFVERGHHAWHSGSSPATMDKNKGQKEKPDLLVTLGMSPRITSLQPCVYV